MIYESLIFVLLLLLIGNGLSFRVVQNHRNHRNYGRRILFQSTVSDESISTITTSGRSNDLLVITNSKSYSYFKTKPYDLSVTWHEVFSKIAKKMVWEGKNNKYEPISGDLNIRIINIEEMFSTSLSSKPTAVEKVIADAIVLVGLGDDESSTHYESALSTLTAAANAVTVFNCSSSISKLEKYGDFYPNAINAVFDPLMQKFDEFCNTRRNTDRKRYEIAVDLWKRNSLDDLVFLMFILIDTYGQHRIKSVQSVTSTEATSFDQVLCMCSSCSKEMLDCFKDETCRKVNEKIKIMFCAFKMYV